MTISAVVYFFAQAYDITLLDGDYDFLSDTGHTKIRSDINRPQC
jgi:hypothetical protein